MVLVKLKSIDVTNISYNGKSGINTSIYSLSHIDGGLNEGTSYYDLTIDEYEVSEGVIVGKKGSQVTRLYSF